MDKYNNVKSGFNRCPFHHVYYDEIESHFITTPPRVICTAHLISFTRLFWLGVNKKKRLIRNAGFRQRTIERK